MNLNPLKPGSHMSPMVGDLLLVRVIIQGENLQSILVMSNITDNGLRRCRRHMRTRLYSVKVAYLCSM